MPRNATEHTYTVEQVKVSDLDVDRRVQRDDLKKKKVEDFVRNYNRDALGVLLEWGLVDSFRQLYGDAQFFTWWDYRAGDFHSGRDSDQYFGNNSERQRRGCIDNGAGWYEARWNRCIDGNAGRTKACWHTKA